jgi:mono/diheme cytochrome c family protein
MRRFASVYRMNAFLLPFAVFSIGVEPMRELTYQAEILPLLKRHCLDCHGPERADANFRVDTYALLMKGGSAGAAVSPGKGETSPLVEYLTGKRAPRMPKKRQALSEAEISKVRDWIDQGAREGKAVAFSGEQIEFFETSIRPLFAQHCTECHGTTKINGNLAILSRQHLIDGGSRGPAIVSGDPESSLLIKAVRHDGKLRMPKNKPRLDDESLRLLAKWVAMGAPWPATNAASNDSPKIRQKFEIYDSDRKHWAFQPVVRPQTPSLSNPSWATDDLDRFILARLEQAKLAPSPPASWQTLMRRLSFDLTGLPPKPEDLREFDAQAPADRKRIARYVDRLLESKEFGVHWARHWQDQVRYRPSQGKLERDDPYRRWLVDAFNRDLPYDQFLKMQIAGNLLSAPKSGEVDLDALIALRPWSIKSRHEEQLDLLGRTFLGLSLMCARCHDHKLEPLSRADYFAMKGIFESSQVVKSPLISDKARFDEYMAGLQRTQANDERMKKQLKELAPLTVIADLRSRIAVERQKLDDSKQNKKAVQANLDKLVAEERNRLEEMKKKGIDLDSPDAKEFLRIRQESNDFTAMWKDVFQFETLVDQADPKRIVDSAPPTLGVEVKPGKPAPTDPPIPRRFPTILAGTKQTALGDITPQSGRLELALWLTDGKHPITARLMANRIWYYLLGEGLAPSLSNFGRSGEPPSHPELLDYLADEFVRDAWSMKRLIRRIVLSSTYQQASASAASADHSERLRLFGVARRKRLEVESIWRTMSILESDAQSTDRRAEPAPDLINEMRLLFDGANSELIVPQRTASVSSLQALFLMNSEHMRASTERFAAKLCRQSDEAERIRQAFRLICGREPSTREIDDGRAFVARWEPRPLSNADGNRKNADVPPQLLAKWQAYVQTLLMTNEFLFVD